MQYFDIKEFSCPCCGLYNMDKEFLVKLDIARSLAGLPFKINSGYRCSKHNEEVGGKETSSHLKGLAADISVSGSSGRFTIMEALFAAGFTRMGLANTFIHVDLDEGKSSNVCWTYL